MTRNANAVVAIMMGSKSDWETMKNCSDTLAKFGIAHQSRVLSAHRTPHEAAEFVTTSEKSGVQVFICAAGGAAHLAGVVAALTVRPVLACPMKGWALDGLDSLLSMAQMPGGVPVGTLAIGKAGAINAALLAIQILSLKDESLRQKLLAHRDEQKRAILAETLG